MTKLLNALLFLAVFPCLGFGQTADTQYEILGLHGVWQTGWARDTFTDEPEAWYANHVLSEVDLISFMCFHSSKYYNFLAFANEESLSGPTRTKIRVDDKPVFETSIDGRSGAFVPYETVDAVLNQMRGGEEVRFRITKSGQTYTFRLSLEGFDAASDWVLQQCEAVPK